MKQKNVVLLLVIAFVIMFLAQSCTKEKCEETTSVSEETEWEQALLKERGEKDAYYKKFPDSPMARCKRLVVLPDQGETFVLENEKDVLLTQEKGPGVKFSVVNEGEQWSWNNLAEGVTCTAGDKPVESGTPMPSRVTFKLDRCILNTYVMKDRVLLMVYDPERPKFKHFSHLYYFPPAPEFNVPAVMEIFPTIEKFKVLTSQNEERFYHRYARIKFDIDGKPCQLTAFKFSMDKDDPDSEILFIPFTDATSGNESYEAGRFLDIHEPKEKEFTLDFNRCYNPLCNYSPGFNCPIPPLENHLEVAIKAGEKAYPH